MRKKTEPDLEEKMVAISLYRGNLHRVPDVPRQWLMPNQRFSVKDFKSLLSRRSKALSHLHSTISNTNPNSTQQEQEAPNSDEQIENQQIQLVLVKTSNPEEGTSKDGGDVKEVEDDQVKGLDGHDRSEEPVAGPNSVPVVELDVVNNASDPVDGNGNLEDVRNEKAAEETVNPELRNTSDKVDALNEKEKRKREVEEKLEVLNAKKHNLVQVLKQILSVEEELKRRNSMQGSAAHPMVPLQVDVANDSALMTRQVATRVGSEANFGGDVEGGEANDVSNPNMHPRHLFRMSSTSPTSESPLRRTTYFQHNVVPHPPRATFVASGSPSRFAPIGNQGHPANIPTVSVSGTNYIVSSPSPAASGGTSVFRDARHPSPWN